MTSVAEIENGIVDAVDAASAASAFGYLIRTVESYGDQLDGSDIAKIAMQFPAVFITYGGEARPIKVGGSTYRHEPTFAAICATRLRGNERRSRHGAGLEPGSYQLFKDVRRLLVGQTFDLDIAELEPGRVRPIFDGRIRKESLSIISIEFHTAYEDGAAEPVNLDDFSTFHAAWDVPLHGNITDPAGDGDATDDLTNLET